MSRRFPALRPLALLLGALTFDAAAVAARSPRPSDPALPSRSAESPYLERARFERVRQGVLVLAPDLAGDTPSRTRSGREDVVAFSNTPAASVLAALKAAHISRVSIGRAFTVEGWAHLAASDSHTFTLELADESRAVIEVFEDTAGVRVVFWGLAAGAQPTRRPITDLPVRLAPR